MQELLEIRLLGPFEVLAHGTIAASDVQERIDLAELCRITLNSQRRAAVEIDAIRRHRSAFAAARMSPSRNAERVSASSSSNRTASTYAQFSAYPSGEPTIDSSPSAARRRAM